MTIFTLIIVGIVLIGVGYIWYRINTDESGAVSCCGCGQCARTGECTMVKKTGKNSASGLTNQPKKI